MAFNVPLWGRDPSVAERMQLLINRSRSDMIRSVHLVIGYHNTGNISSKIAEARLSRDPAKLSFHAGPMWIIHRAMQRAGSQIALIDLNPDTSEVNRTVIMQSTDVFIPTWPDKDGTKCMVDLKCRIMGGLDQPPRPGQSMLQYRARWAQIHRDLIEATAGQVSYPLDDADGLPLSVADRYPRLLGLIVNSVLHHAGQRRAGC